MASIRKTKKCLKRQIAELWIDFSFVNKMALNPIEKAHFKDAIYQHIQMLEQELSNLKLKRKKVTILTQSDFLKDLDPAMHDVMAHREAIPFKELGVKSVKEYREEIKRRQWNK